ncbi:hypothetical protein Ae201684P_017943 [Aphanomyces euteiches]|nr:hypothetical protein Ae201684P_017943 [Aphanomyces euteiches]
MAPENLRRASLHYEGVLQENEDDKTFGDLDTPYIDSYASQGTQAFITMTKLSLSEFNRLCANRAFLLRTIPKCSMQLTDTSLGSNINGYKPEGSVAMPGRYIDVSDHHPGSVSDVTIFMTRINKHRLMLSKTEDDKKMIDIREGSSAFPKLWATLQDKGYQGVGDAICSIRPAKKTKNVIATRQEIERNNRVSSDRVLVENMFGRTCSLWKIAYATFTWSEETYDLVLRLVWALTNFHTALHPLRAQDKEFYSSVMARWLKSVLKRRNANAKQVETVVRFVWT